MRRMLLITRLTAVDMPGHCFEGHVRNCPCVLSGLSPASAKWLYTSGGTQGNVEACKSNPKSMPSSLKEVFGHFSAIFGGGEISEDLGHPGSGLWAWGMSSSSVVVRVVSISSSKSGTVVVVAGGVQEHPSSWCSGFRNTRIFHATELVRGKLVWKCFPQ